MTSVSSARKLATWDAIVHTLDVLIATNMDMSQQLPHKIPPSGMPA